VPLISALLFRGILWSMRFIEARDERFLRKLMDAKRKMVKDLKVRVRVVRLWVEQVVRRHLTGGGSVCGIPCLALARPLGRLPKLYIVSVRVHDHHQLPVPSVRLNQCVVRNT
jgi:hypothetical protein